MLIISEDLHKIGHLELRHPKTPFNHTVKRIANCDVFSGGRQDWMLGKKEQNGKQ